MRLLWAHGGCPLGAERAFAVRRFDARRLPVERFPVYRSPEKHAISSVIVGAFSASSIAAWLTLLNA